MTNVPHRVELIRARDERFVEYRFANGLGVFQADGRGLWLYTGRVHDGMPNTWDIAVTERGDDCQWWVTRATVLHRVRDADSWSVREELLGALLGRVASLVRVEGPAAMPTRFRDRVSGVPVLWMDPVQP